MERGFAPSPLGFRPAPARGHGTWPGYEVRRQMRTPILQSENEMRRIKQEVEHLPNSMDAGMNPPEDGGKQTVTEATMAQLFQDDRRVRSRKAGVSALKDLGISQASAYRMVDLEKTSPFKHRLTETDGLLSWSTE